MGMKLLTDDELLELEAAYARYNLTLPAHVSEELDRRGWAKASTAMIDEDFDE